MCDSSASIKGYITSKDVLNSQKYAKMKIMHEMATSPIYNGKLEWVNYRQDGTSSYPCPPGLVCKDGYVRIKTEEECNRVSNWHQYWNTQNPKDMPDPDANNGYYLEWRKDNQGQGQCYYGNAQFRVLCESGNFDPDSKTYGRGVIVKPGLNYDKQTGRCLITKEYCDSSGQFGYISPDPNNPSAPGGTCQLSSGQKWIDFFFGSTVSRGLWGGACFEEKKTKKFLDY